jgi:perosamine synthetase
MSACADCGSGRDMREIADDAVVIDGRVRIDDDAASGGHTRRNDRPGTDDRSLPNDSARRHAGSRMNRRGEPLSGGKQPLRHCPPRAIVAQRNDHRVMGDVPERCNWSEHLEIEHGGSQMVRRVVDKSDRHCVGARLMRALQDVSDDGSLAAGTDYDNSPPLRTTRSSQHLRYRSAVIPLSSPDINEDDVRLVNDVLRSRYLASGPTTEQFEKEVAERFGARFAVAVSSGTAALHLGIIAAGVSDGDFVITSPYSFVASANAILYERGIPVFVDIDPDTLTIHPGKTIEVLRDLAQRRSGWRDLLPRSARNSSGVLRAVLPVHLFGRTAEIREVVDAAREAGIAVIEDACEAIAASSDGVYAGRWGDAGAFGFYPNKQITTGEGGMLLTDHEGWADLFRCLRNQGRSRDSERFRHDRLGFNYRMDEMSAALGLAQFRRLDELLLKRESVADRYTALLSPVDGVNPLPDLPAGRIRTWFLYAIRLAPEIDRDAVMHGLARAGIMTRPYFWPIHLQPFYAERFGFVEGDFPAAEAAGRSMLALPMSPNLSDDEIEYVCAAVTEQVSAYAV